MAAEIFGAGLNGHIHAEVMRAEKQRRCPRIVHQRGDTARGGGSDDGGYVLDLERLGARGLEEDGAGVGADEAGDVAGNERVIIGGFDPVARQHLVADAARRLIGAVDHQQMIAGL